MRRREFHGCDVESPDTPNETAQRLWCEKEVMVHVIEEHEQTLPTLQRRPIDQMTDAVEQTLLVNRKNQHDAAWREDSSKLAQSSDRILKVLNDVPERDQLEMGIGKMRLLHEASENIETSLLASVAGGFFRELDPHCLPSLLLSGDHERAIGAPNIEEAPGLDHALYRAQPA